MFHEAGDVCRLVDDDGQVVGAQEFVAALTTVNVLWVWNADRTRAFVTLSAVASGPIANPLPQGTYRIQWQFMRDISATGQPPLTAFNSCEYS
jgi:hypothetical protein